MTIRLRTPARPPDARQSRRRRPWRGLRDACGRRGPGGLRNCGWRSRRCARPARACRRSWPEHMEHPAERHSNPASRNILSRPSCSACSFTRPEPGTTMAPTWAATLRPLAMAAARAQILDAAVGARADEHAVHLHFATAACRASNPYRPARARCRRACCASVSAMGSGTTSP